MNEIITRALYIIVPILFLFLYPWHLENKRRLKSLDIVQECETTDLSELLGHLDAMYDLEDLPSECKIGIDKERKAALRIIDDFKKDLGLLLFHDCLPKTKKEDSNSFTNFFFTYFQLNIYDYFLHYLCSYLLKNEKDIDATYERSGYTHEEKECLTIVFYKILLISYIHSCKKNISGYTGSGVEHIRSHLKWRRDIRKRNFFRASGFHEKFPPYAGNDPDLGDITRKYIEEQVYESGLLLTDILQMINKKRIDAGVIPVFEDEIF